jgi:hypothetical protein
MFIKPALAVALCAGYVAAQAGANSTIDPNSVSATLRSMSPAAWEIYLYRALLTIVQASGVPLS